jgi:ribosomal protein S18 acetylase RimI-like enzyme
MTSINELQFLEFSKELAKYFKTINQQWIEKMFTMESLDEDILSHPKKLVIEPGGRIWFAKHPSLGVVGTCAILKKSTGVFELTKMGVLDEARGLKIGEKLLQHALANIEAMNLDCLFLLTNSKCEAAIHLYEKNGFFHDPEILNHFGEAYSRCNVAMRYRKAQ